MTRLFSLALIASICLFGGARASFAQLPPVETGPQQPTGYLLPTSQLPDTVAFELWNGMVVVRAFVGDGLPELAIIDTALPVCLISPELAAKKTLKTEGIATVSVLDRTVTVGDAKQHVIRINRVMVSGVPCGVTNLFEHLSAKQPADAPPVWLGTSALGALSFTIDPLRREITFRPPNAPLPNKAIKVPFEMREGRMWVKVKANGKKEFSALVDTTAVGTLLPASVAKELGVIAEQTFTTVASNGKEGKVAAVQLDEIELGGLKVKDVQAIYVTDGEKVCDPQLGVIGNDVLLRYKVTFDYPHRLLLFEELPIPKPAAPAAGGAAVQMPPPTAGTPGGAPITFEPPPGGTTATTNAVVPNTVPRDPPKDPRKQSPKDAKEAGKSPDKNSPEAKANRAIRGLPRSISRLVFP